MTSNKAPMDDREEEAKRILERIEQEAETVGTSSMKRVAERVKDHMTAEDADQNVWAERWGTRIGRTLGAVFFVGLIVYLLQTYIF